MKKKQQQRAVQSVDTRLYSSWQALYRSFYSFRLYADVGLRWKGFGFRYLLLLIGLLCIPVGVKLQYVFNDYYTHHVIEPLALLPDIVVKKGTVFFDKPMPYYVRNAAGDVVAIIDTTKKVQRFPEKYPELHLLITKHIIFYRYQPSVVTNTTSGVYIPPVFKEQHLTSEDSLTMSGDALMHLPILKRLHLMFSLMLYPGVVGGSYAVIAGFLFMFASLGQIAASTVMKCKLSYKQSSRLMMVAATPMLFVVFGLFIANKSLPASALIHGVLLIVYFCFGVLGVKRATRALVRA
jgi:hypothetical protein